jgi:membrane carboxypeptidase/penicillin-binding protein
VADEQIITMMQGVVQHGTGIKVAAVGKPLAGKTGTTSDWFDGWFVGFSPELVAGAYMGFDTPRTLGDGEVGGNTAAPIFRDFMAAALKDQPAMPFPEGGGEMVLINAYSGQATAARDPNAVLMAYRPSTAPSERHPNANPAMAGMPGASSQQEASEAIDGAAPDGQMPYGVMPNGQTAAVPGASQAPSGSMGSPMMPVNARVPGAIPAGTAVPSPPRIMPGTGGLY